MEGFSKRSTDRWPTEGAACCSHGAFEKVTTGCGVWKAKSNLILSLQPWSAVHCGVKSLWVYWVCVCAHLAVNQRESLAPFFFLHSSNVAGWHTDNALSLCLLLACRAARSGLAVPDTEEAQGRRPAPWGSTDGLWAVCACHENVILVILVGL